MLPILAAGGLKAGKDFFLAYSPEREDPGNPKFSAAGIPKVVGGIEAGSAELAEALYSQAVVKVVPVSNCEVAEACKILENTYRSVNIAMVNELKVLFDRMGIDIWEVINAAKTKPFGYQAFYPGPGLGGHCIPIDPFYLSWVARKHGLATRFIELAGEINTSMPLYVIHRLAEALNDAGKPVRGSNIALLGIAYKKDVDDPRESPSFELLEMLLARGASVTYNDPHVPKLPRMRHHCHAGNGQPAIDRRLPGGPGLRADRHRPLGLRLRFHRPPLAAGNRYPQRHATGARRPRKNPKGLIGLEPRRRGEEMAANERR